MKITGAVSPSNSNPSPDPAAYPNRRRNDIENIAVSRVLSPKTRYGKDCPPTPTSPTNVKDVEMSIVSSIAKVQGETEEQLEFDQFLMDAAEWL